MRSLRPPLPPFQKEGVGGWPTLIPQVTWGFLFWGWLFGFLFYPLLVGAPLLVPPRLKAAFLVLESLNSQSTGSGDEHETVDEELW